MTVNQDGRQQLDRRRVLRVRLVDAAEWPRHGGSHTGLKGERWPEWRGKWITVYAAPRRPNAKWTCGTQDVWNVTPESVREIYPECPEDKLGEFHVCEHQIELADPLA